MNVSARYRLIAVLCYLAAYATHSTNSYQLVGIFGVGRGTTAGPKPRPPAMGWYEGSVPGNQSVIGHGVQFKLVTQLGYKGQPFAG